MQVCTRAGDFVSWLSNSERMTTVILLLACTTCVHFATGYVANVALGKRVHSSSFKPGYSAGSAVDGNTNTEGFTQLNIIDTGPGYDSAWWKVDLEREVLDSPVRIYFRRDYKWRRNGVNLYTSTIQFPTSNPTRQGQLCHSISGDPSGIDIPDVYNVTCPGRWRYLLLYTDTDNHHDGFSTGPTLDFGEVMVFGCSYNTYGPTCTARCGGCGGACDSVNGSCHAGCRLGFIGAKCDRYDMRVTRMRRLFDIEVYINMLVGGFFVMSLFAACIQMGLDR